MVHGVHYPSQTLDEPSASFSHESFKEEPEEMEFQEDTKRSVVELPQDVEDLVLARLPVSALYKARPVCKRWHSLLTDDHFLNLRDKIQGQQEATFFPLVFWHDEKATLKISRTGSRIESIDHLEPIYPVDSTGEAEDQRVTWSWAGYDSSIRRWQAMKPFTTPIDVKSIITGSKGLLCLRGEDCLLVVNPMTGSRRLVPFQDNIVQLVVNTASNSFKILSAASRKRTKIYDSETRMWCKRGRPAPNLSLAKHNGAYCDGVLYCVAREERSATWGVVKYDVEGARTWSPLILFPSQPGERSVKAKVIHYGGEIFALVETESYSEPVHLTPGTTKRLSLWNLERASSKWRLAGTMPAQSLQHLENLIDFDCVALNNRMCILNKSTFKAVVCLLSDCVVTSWQQLSLDSYFSAKTPLVERCIVQFPLEPSLLVSA